MHQHCRALMTYNVTNVPTFHQHPTSQLSSVIQPIATRNHQTNTNRKMRSSIILLAPLLHLASAGQAISYLCSTDGKATSSGAAAGQLMAQRVVYSYDAADCPDSLTRTWDAFTGLRSPLEGLVEFCGGEDGSGVEYSDDFCGNVDLFGTTGLHIVLDGHNVALRTSTSSTDLDPTSDSSIAMCSLIGLTTPYGLTEVSVSTWEGVTPPLCV